MIHDAFLIEAAADRITDAVATTQRVMAEASRRVLRGVLTLRSDAQVIPPGDRFRPSTGGDTWAWVLGATRAGEVDAGAAPGNAMPRAGAAPMCGTLTYLPSSTYLSTKEERSRKRCLGQYARSFSGSRPVRRPRPAMHQDGWYAIVPLEWAQRAMRPLSRPRPAGRAAPSGISSGGSAGASLYVTGQDLAFYMGGSVDTARRGLVDLARAELITLTRRPRHSYLVTLPDERTLQAWLEEQARQGWVRGTET